MGRYLFRLPDVGEGVAEAEITAWHVKAGDRVAEDQPLVDVMTDKATVDVSSPVAGVVTTIHGAVGDSVPVGSTLVEFEVDGAGNAGAEAAPVPVAAKAQPQEKGGAEPAYHAPLAAPATRHRAHELGISLESVPGTGPGGRITPEDLDAYIAHSGAKPPEPGKRIAIHDIRIIGLRRKIAERMQESKRRIPHFSYVEELDMTELEGLRRELNEERHADRPKLTLLPFFMRALVSLQPEFPEINAQFDDEAGILHAYEAVHIGIATQTPGGLMVPVVRHAEVLDLWDCAKALARVIEAARDGSAKPEDLKGSTITLTSLGALGGISATPVINAPEVAIIGPNKMVDRPVVMSSQVVIRTMMNLSSSFDHRIIDGHTAARFVQRLKRLIEHPALLFVEHP